MQPLFLPNIYMQSERHIPVLLDSHSSYCLPKPLMPSSRNRKKKKNPRKTAKLLWPFSLHKATVHFSNQMLPSNIKKRFCKWHTSSRNRNSELQPLFAWVQRHLELSNCWIPVWRKRIPWLSVFLLHSVRTAKNKPPANDHWMLIRKCTDFHTTFCLPPGTDGISTLTTWYKGILLTKVQLHSKSLIQLFHHIAIKFIHGLLYKRNLGC